MYVYTQVRSHISGGYITSILEQATTDLIGEYDQDWLTLAAIGQMLKDDRRIYFWNLYKRYGFGPGAFWKTRVG